VVGAARLVALSWVVVKDVASGFPVLLVCICWYKDVVGPVSALGTGARQPMHGSDSDLMSYDRKPADNKIVSYLRSIDHSAKAREIAEAIDYHPSYIGKRCRVMSGVDIIDRQEGGFIIGHDIPGRDNPTILNSDRSYLLSLVKEHEPDRLSKARSMSVKELQKFIKREIATSTYPLGNKTVSYSLG